MKDIIQKFKFKGDVTVVNAPTELKEAVVALGASTILDPKTKNKDTLVFVNNSNEYHDFLTDQLATIEPDSVLWIAYPKGSSGVKTDINRDTLRVKAEAFGMTTVTAISINETWSALRFRPIDKVGK